MKVQVRFLLSTVRVSSLNHNELIHILVKVFNVKQSNKISVVSEIPWETTIFSHDHQVYIMMYQDKHEMYDMSDYR